MSSLEAVAIFVLAAMPGILAGEIIQFSRPRLRVRDAGGTLALYVLLSGAAWAIGLAAFDAEDRLVNLVQLNEAQAGELIGTFVPLAVAILGAGVVVGIVFRALLPVKDHGAYRLRRVASTTRDGRASRLALLLSSKLLPDQAWDRMLARAARQGRAQIVRVLLRDGRLVYGTFAAEGRADFDADGRGLLLDRELVEDDGGLLNEVPDGSGVYVHPDAVATVSFVDRPSDQIP